MRMKQNQQFTDSQCIKHKKTPIGGPQILIIGMKGTNCHSTIYETKNV